LAAEEIASGAAMARVAKLVDAYLAEVALESGLGVKEFEELARALPAHSRATDDGLYRAVDTFLKVS
jgi:NPH3 family